MSPFRIFSTFYYVLLLFPELVVVLVRLKLIYIARLRENVDRLRQQEEICPEQRHKTTTAPQLNQTDTLDFSTISSK